MKAKLLLIISIKREPTAKICDRKYNSFILISKNIHPYKRWHRASFRISNVTCKWQPPGEQECSAPNPGPESLGAKAVPCSKVSHFGRFSAGNRAAGQVASPGTGSTARATVLSLFLSIISTAASVGLFQAVAFRKSRRVAGIGFFFCPWSRSRKA